MVRTQQGQRDLILIQLPVCGDRTGPVDVDAGGGGGDHVQGGRGARQGKASPIDCVGVSSTTCLMIKIQSDCAKHFPMLYLCCVALTPRVTFAWTMSSIGAPTEARTTILFASNVVV